MLFARLWRFEVGRGLDVGVFGLGSYYAFFAPKPGTNPLDYVYTSRWVGVVILAAWAAQGFGAWMKRWPLHQRLSQRATDPALRSPLKDAQNQIFCFTCWHALISGMMFFAGAVNLLPELRNLDHVDHWTNPVLVLAGVAISLVPTLMVWRALVPPKAAAPPRPWMADRRTEFVADQLLTFSYVVLSVTILGEAAMLQGTRPINPEGIIGWAATLLLLVPLLWLALVWFFVPFRMLLMLEELGTWKSRLALFAAMLPLISQYIVG